MLSCLMHSDECVVCSHGNIVFLGWSGCLENLDFVSTWQEEPFASTGSENANLRCYTSCDCSPVLRGHN